MSSRSFMQEFRALFKMKGIEYLEWFIRLGLFAVIFLPLIFHSKTYFPFIVFKNILFRTFIEILFGAYIILAYKKNNFRPKINPVFFFLILYFFILVFTTIVSADPFRSFWGDYERMGGLLGMLHLFAYYIILIGVLRRKQDWHALFTFSIFVSVIMSFFALAQWLEASILLRSGGGDRLTGTVGNAIYLAAYILLHLYLIFFYIIKEQDFSMKVFFWSVVAGDLFLLLHDLYIYIAISAPPEISSPAVTPFFEKLPENKIFLYIFLLFHVFLVLAYILKKLKWIKKFFLLSILFFELFIFFWTQTRGAMVAFIFGVFFLLIFFAWEKRKTYVGKIIFSVFAIVFILAGLMFIFRDSELVQKIPSVRRLATVRFDEIDITTYSRVLTWKAGILGWRENPFRFLFGYGLENFFVPFNKYFPAAIYRDVGSQIWFDRAHNIVLDTGVSAGLFGLMAYLGLYAAFVFAVLKYYKKTGDFALAGVFSALLFSYFIQNLFVFDTLDSYIIFFTTLGFGSFLYYESGSQVHWMENLAKRQSAFFTLQRKQYVEIFLFTLIPLLVFFLVYFFNIRVYRANRLIHSAVRRSQEYPKNYRENVEDFKRAIEKSLTGRTQARHLLASYVVDISGRDDVKVKDMAYLADTATQEVEKNLLEEPLDARHYLLLASLYNRFNSLNTSYAPRAKEILEQGVLLSPSRPHFYFELGNTYINLGQKEIGLELVKKGMALARNIKDARVLLLLSYLRAGKIEEAEKEVDYILEHLVYRLTSKEIRDFVSYFNKYERYETIIKLYKVLVVYEPTSLNYAQLAVYYGYAGDRYNAEKEILKSLEIDPSRKKEVDKFLKILKEGDVKKLKIES